MIDNTKDFKKHLTFSSRRRLVQNFLNNVQIPVAFIGLIGGTGSGRTTAGEMLESHLRGFKHIQSDSARFIINEENESRIEDERLFWGRNVSEIVAGAVRQLLENGHGVILDGNTAREEERKILHKICFDLKVPEFYIYIKTDSSTAKEREWLKYENKDWVSNFRNCRVNTTFEMLKSVTDQHQFWNEFKPSLIEGLVGTIDNNGVLYELRKQVQDLVPMIQDKLQVG